MAAGDEALAAAIDAARNSTPKVTLTCKAVGNERNRTIWGYEHAQCHFDNGRLVVDGCITRTPAGAARHVLTAIGISLAFFLLLAPSLDDLEFSNAGENNVVAAALELRRGGPWLIPMLHGQDAAQAPADHVDHCGGDAADTVQQLSSPDALVRRAAFEQLAWQTRWPALLAACLMLAAVYGMGAVVDGPRLGVAAARCAGRRSCSPATRLATTDVQLALWATVANLSLAAAVLDRRFWLGLAGGGVALGLALMSKGPSR